MDIVLILSFGFCIRSRSTRRIRLSFSKLFYCARIIGSTHLQPLLLTHSDKLRAALRYLVGQELSEVQWRQATFSRADIAMVWSWQATWEQIRSLFGLAAVTDIDLDRTLALRTLSPHFPHLRLDNQHIILSHRDLT